MNNIFGFLMTNLSWIIMFYISCSWIEVCSIVFWNRSVVPDSMFIVFVFFVLGNQQSTNYATQCTSLSMHYPLNQLTQNQFLLCSWKLFLERRWTCSNIRFGKKMNKMIYKPWRSLCVCVHLIWGSWVYVFIWYFKKKQLKKKMHMLFG